MKDTKAPEVAVPADIEVLQGTDLATFDFKSLMSVSDASETTIDVDTSKVDVNTPSQYDINVTVTDKHGNKNVKAGKVTVTAKPEISDDEQVIQETVKNSDGTTSVRNSVQKRSQSSGKKVVSNSSNVTRKVTRKSSTSSQSASGNRTSGSSNKNPGSSSSGNHKGSMKYEDDPNNHSEAKYNYGNGGYEQSGESWDKLTGGDWKDFN